MKTALASMMTLLISTAALADVHYPANHCEIFVDKVVAEGPGSHVLIGVGMYVKILPSRLDGKVAEIGFRNRMTHFQNGYGPAITGEWSNRPLQSFMDAKDYYYLMPLTVGGDYTGSPVWEGAFYVKTVNGTYYWAKPSPDQNFVINSAIWKKVRSAGVPTGGGYQRVVVPTQEESLKYFNPGRCY